MYKEAGFHEYSPFTGRPMETAWVLEECYKAYDRLAWKNQIPKSALYMTPDFELNVALIRQIKEGLLKNHGIHSEERYGASESLEHCHLRLQVEYTLDPCFLWALGGLFFKPEVAIQIPRILIWPIRDLEAILTGWGIPEERIILWNRTLRGIRAADSPKALPAPQEQHKTGEIIQFSTALSARSA